MLSLPVVLLASEGASSFDISSVMTSAVNSVQSNLFSVLDIVVPAAVAVVGAVVAVKFGIKWLKSLGGHS